MSDNATAVILPVIVFGYFIVDHFIDAWRERGIARSRALEAQNRAATKEN